MEHTIQKSDRTAQPFPRGAMGSMRWRIPSLLVTKNQTLLAAADARWEHGQDCPGNLETVAARSRDDGHTWERSFVNHFEDVCDASERCIFSAGFIDPVMAQDENGRIYLLTDLCPPFVGAFTGNGIVCGKQSGRHANGRLALKEMESYDHAEPEELNEHTYPLYAGDADGHGFRKVLRLSDHTCFRGYLLDADMYLYRMHNGLPEPVMIPQLDREGRLSEILIHANIFFAASPVKVYPTYYVVCRVSDDDGKTWGKMQIVSTQIGSRGFTAVSPGRGISCRYQGKERVIIPIYDNNLGTEFAGIIYTEDGGITWNRGARAKETGIMRHGEYVKSSESQLVLLPDHTLRMYSRNLTGRIIYADSTDGGMTWSPFIRDPQLSYCGNCMISVINYSKEIGGRPALIASFPAGDGTLYHRVNGMIAIGLVDEKTNLVEWKYQYPVNHGPYYYSCLAELPDGTVALLYEYEEFAMRYQIYHPEDLQKGGGHTNGAEA